MTKVEVVKALRALEPPEQQEWMLRLGYEMTVYARDCYDEEPPADNTKHLIGFNEIQHRIYGRIDTLQRLKEWTEDSFIEGMLATARFYDIEGLVTAAVQKVATRML